MSLSITASPFLTINAKSFNPKQIIIVQSGHQNENIDPDWIYLESKIEKVRKKQQRWIRRIAGQISRPSNKY